MKIVQVCHSYLPHIGGIELYVYRLSRDLKNKGNEVEVVTTNLGITKNAKELNSIFPVNYFDVTFNFIRNPISLGMYKYLKNKSFDIIHLHSIWFFPSVMAILTRKNARIITTVHGTYPDEASFFIKLCLNIFKPIAKFICKKSDLIIALSENEKKKLIKLFKVPAPKIKVIPNGLDFEIAKEKEKIKLKKKYKIKDEKIILFTGRIIKDKNPDILIKSLKYLNKKVKYKLIFVGPVSEAYKNTLIKIAKVYKVDNKKIIFVDSLHPIKDKNQLMAFYGISDVFISIGSWEGLPTRILEAMLQKVPCIIYDPRGTNLIKDKENGLVIRKLDSTHLGKQLSNLFLNNQLSKKISENSWNFVKRFDWTNIKEEIYKEYTSLIKERNKPRK